MMNRHLHTNHDYGYRRRPEDCFPERRLPEDSSSHYERDFPSTNTAHGYIAGHRQWNEQPGYHRPELSPSISGNMPFSNSIPFPPRDIDYDRRDEHRYASDFQHNVPHNLWQPQRDVYHADPPRLNPPHLDPPRFGPSRLGPPRLGPSRMAPSHYYNDSGHDVFSRNDDPYRARDLNISTGPQHPVYRETQPQRNSPSDFFGSIPRQSGFGDEQLPRPQSVPPLYDRSRTEPQDRAYGSTTGLQINDSFQDTPSIRPSSSFNDQGYSAPRSIVSGSRYTGSKPPRRHSPPPTRSRNRHPSYSTSSGRADHSHVQSESARGASYRGSRNDRGRLSSRSNSREDHPRQRRSSREDKGTSIEKRPIAERLDIRSEPVTKSTMRSPSSLGSGKLGNRFKSSTSTFETRLGPVLDDSSRNSIQSRLGPSPDLPGGNIHARLGPQIDQSHDLPPPTQPELPPNFQESLALIAIAGLLGSVSNPEPPSDLRLKLQEQRRDRDLTSSSASPIFPLPPPGPTSSHSLPDQRPRTLVPLAAESKVTSCGISSSRDGERKQGHLLVKSPPQPLLKSRQSSKSRSSTPALTPPEGEKTTETKKSTPIIIKRPKATGNSSLIQTSPGKKSSALPKGDSTSPSAEPSKEPAPKGSPANQKKAAPSEDHTAKKGASDLPTTSPTSKTSAKPGTSALSTLTTSPLIKPSLFTSKPLPGSQPVKAEPTLSSSSSNLSAIIVKQEENSSGTTHSSSLTVCSASPETPYILPNPFSNADNSCMSTTLMSQNTTTQSAPTSSSKARRYSGGPITSPPAQEKQPPSIPHTHPPSLSQQPSPLLDQATPPPLIPAGKVEKADTETVKPMNLVLRPALPEGEDKPRKQDPKDQKGRRQMSSIDLPLLAVKQAEETMIHDVLPFSGFNETEPAPPPLFPPVQSTSAQHIPWASSHIEDDDTSGTQPKIPRLSVRVKDSVARQLEDGELGESDDDGDSDGGLVIDETASATEDSCADIKDTEGKQDPTVAASTPPVSMEMETSSPISSSQPRSSQSYLDKLDAKNPIQKDPCPPKPGISGTDALPPQSGRLWPNEKVGRVEKAARSALGNHLVIVLKSSPRPSGKGQTLLKKIYSSCVRVFAYKGRTRTTQVISFMRDTFQGFAFGSDVGPSWNPPNPAAVFTSELKHAHRVCGSDVPKWWKHADRFEAASRRLQKARVELRRMMKEGEEASSRKERIPVLTHGKLHQHQRQPRFGETMATFSASSLTPPSTATAPHSPMVHPHTTPSYHQPPPLQCPETNITPSIPVNSTAETVEGLQLLTDTLTHPPLRELQPKSEPIWYEDHSGEMGNLTEFEGTPNVLNAPLPPLTKETVASVRETPEELRELLARVPVSVEQYQPSAGVGQYSQLPLSGMDLDVNLEHVAMDLDEDDEPGDETMEPADANFTNQQIEQLQSVVDQLLELEKHVQRTVEHLNPLATESYDYGHNPAILPPLPLDSTQSMPPPPPAAQDDQRQQLDFSQTQDSLPYCEYPPFPVLSDHTPSAPLNESNIPVEPVEVTGVTADTMPSVKVQPSESVSSSPSSETKKTAQSDSSSNAPQISVSASQNETGFSESIQTRPRDRSLSPGEITPSPEPPPDPDNKEPGSFACFVPKEQHTSPTSHLSHLPHLPHSHSSLHSKRMSDSPLPPSSSQLRSGRTGYSRRYYRSRSRSHSPRRKHRYRSHSRTPSPRGSLKSWRSRATRSPSPSRHHHYSSSSHMHRGHRPSSAASRNRRTDSDSSPPRRYRRSSRSRSRSLSPIRERRSRRSRSCSPSRRTSRRSQNQSVSPARSRRSHRGNSSRSPVHSSERRKDHGGIVQAKSGNQDRAHSPTQRSIPKPSTESESEEEMELLRLKREAIMSMIQKGNAAKPTDTAKSEAETLSGKEEGLKSSNVGMEPGKDVLTGTAECLEGTLQDGERKENSAGERKDDSEEVNLKMVEESSNVTTADVKSEGSGGGETVDVNSASREEAQVELKTCETHPPGPQESVKPVEPVQQALVHKPTEAVEGMQLTVPATVRSKPPSKRSTPTCQVGSKTSSPAVSPPPPSSSTALEQREQKTRSLAPANKTTVGLKPTSSAKVCPGNEETWRIQEPFRIVSGSGDSETSDSGSESDPDMEVAQLVKPVPLRPAQIGIEEINKMLMEARKAAEAKVKSPASQLHPSPPAPLPPTRKKLESTSSSDGLELPSPPATLRPEQKREYLELQKRLALHKKRKRREMKSTKEKERRGEMSTLSIQPTGLRAKSRSTSPTDQPSKRPRIKRPTSKKVAMVAEREKNRQVEACMMKISQCETAITNSRSQLEGEQRELTSLTNCLTECESVIEEHELKIELLKKQLKIAEENHSKAEKKRSQLQERVRFTKEQILRHNSTLQEAERSLSKEKETLRSLQHSSGVTLTHSASSEQDQSNISTCMESGVSMAQSRVAVSVTTTGEKSAEDRVVTSERDVSLRSREEESRGQQVSVMIQVTSEAGATVTEPVTGKEEGSDSEGMLTEFGVRESSVSTDDQSDRSPFLLRITPEYEAISDSETGDLTKQDLNSGSGTFHAESEVESVLECSRETLPVPRVESGITEQGISPCRSQSYHLANPLINVEPVSDTEDVARKAMSPFQTEMVSDSENLELESVSTPPSPLQTSVLQVTSSTAAIENISDSEDTMDRTVSKPWQQKKVIEDVSGDEGGMQVSASRNETSTTQLLMSGNSAFRKVSEMEELGGHLGGVGHEMHHPSPMHYSPVEIEAISDEEINVSSTVTSSSLIASEVIDKSEQVATNTEPLLAVSSRPCWSSGSMLDLQITKVESLSASDDACLLSPPSSGDLHPLGQLKSKVGKVEDLQLVEKVVGQTEVEEKVNETAGVTSQPFSIVRIEHSYSYPPELWALLAEPPELSAEEGEEKDVDSPASISLVEHATSRSSTPSDLSSSCSSIPPMADPTKLTFLPISETLLTSEDLTNILLSLSTTTGRRRKSKSEKPLSPKPLTAKKSKESKKRRRPKRLKLQAHKGSASLRTVSSVSSPSSSGIASTLNKALHSALSPPLISLISPDNLPRIMSCIQEAKPSSSLQTPPSTVSHQKNSLERAVLQNLTQSVANRLGGITVSNSVTPASPQTPTGFTSATEVSPIVSEIVNQTVQSLTVGDILAVSALDSSLHSVHVPTRVTNPFQSQLPSVSEPASLVSQPHAPQPPVSTALASQSHTQQPPVSTSLASQSHTQRPPVSTAPVSQSHTQRPPVSTAPVSQSHAQRPPVSTALVSQSHAHQPPVSTALASQSHTQRPPVSTAPVSQSHAQRPPVSTALVSQSHAHQPPVSTALVSQSHAQRPPVSTALVSQSHAQQPPVSTALVSQSHAQQPPVSTALVSQSHAHHPPVSVAPFSQSHAQQPSVSMVPVSQSRIKEPSSLYSLSAATLPSTGLQSLSAATLPSTGLQSLSAATLPSTGLQSLNAATLPSTSLQSLSAATLPSTGLQSLSAATLPSTGLQSLSAATLPSTGLQSLSAASLPSTGLQSLSAASLPSTSLQSLSTATLPSTSLQSLSAATLPSTGLQSLSAASLPSTGLQSLSAATLPSTGLQSLSAATLPSTGLQSLSAATLPFTGLQSLTKLPLSKPHPVTTASDPQEPVSKLPPSTQLSTNPTAAMTTVSNSSSLIQQLLTAPSANPPEPVGAITQSVAQSVTNTEPANMAAQRTATVSATKPVPTASSQLDALSVIKREPLDSSNSPSPTPPPPQYSVCLPITFPTSFTAPSNSFPDFTVPRIVPDLPLEIAPPAVNFSVIKFLVERKTKPPQASVSSTKPPQASVSSTTASSDNTLTSGAKVDTSLSVGTGPLAKSSTGAVSTVSLPANYGSNSTQVTAGTGPLPPQLTTAVVLAQQLPKPPPPSSLVPRGTSSTSASIVQLLPKILPAAQKILAAKLAQLSNSSSSKLNTLPPSYPSHPPPPSSMQQGQNTGIKPLAEQASSVVVAGSNVAQTQTASSTQLKLNPASVHTLALASALTKAVSKTTSVGSVLPLTPNVVPGSLTIRQPLSVSKAGPPPPGGRGGTTPTLRVPPDSKLSGQILNLQKGLAQLKGQLAAKTGQTGLVIQPVQKAITMATTAADSATTKRPFVSTTASTASDVEQGDSPQARQKTALLAPAQQKLSSSTQTLLSTTATAVTQPKSPTFQAPPAKVFVTNVAVIPSKSKPLPSSLQSTVKPSKSDPLPSSQQSTVKPSKSNPLPSQQSTVKPSKSDPLPSSQQSTVKPSKSDPLPSSQQSTVKPSKSDPLPSSQQSTVKPSKSDPLPSSQLSTSTSKSMEVIQQSNLREVLKKFGIEKSPEDLRVLCSSVCILTPVIVNVRQLLDEIRPLSHSVFSGTQSSHLPALKIPESVIESLEKQKRGSMLSQDREIPSKEEPFKPYSSPLLMFQSYRLSPYFRTQAKLPLSSLTHSNKINPQKIMCKFELLGICIDPKCPYQHFRDVNLSREELVQDIIFYQPTLAGCTESELSVVDESLPALQGAISEKVSGYARSFMQSYGRKVTDEELYALATHEVNQERIKLNPKIARKSFVSVEERYWVQERNRISTSVQHRQAREAPLFVGIDKVGEGEEVMPLGERQQLRVSSQAGRYFATGESESVEERVRRDPEDTAAWVELAQTATGREEALSYLKQGLEANISSEELWVEFLRAKSHDRSSIKDRPSAEGAVSQPTSTPIPTVSTTSSEADTTVITGEEGWEELCTRAMESQPSYAVAFECIRLAQTYDTKQKWIREGLKRCCNPSSTPPTPTSSHQSLELLLNSALLDILSGRKDNAVATLDSALFSREQQQLPPFVRLSSQLTQEDRALACLTRICLAVSNTLPHTLFESPDSSPPARIIRTRHDSMIFPWNKTVNLSQEKRKKTREMFQASVDLCTGESSTPSPSTPTTLIPLLLALHKNFILFEFAQNQDKAIAMLEKLLKGTPTEVELWILYARLEEERGGGSLGVLARAVERCPQTAELYYLAARTILNRASVPAAERLTQAVRWLEKCVRQFYQISTETKPDHTETLLLYRKLLRQLVPYTYQPPEFAEGVDPKQLGQNLTHLWLCYCLLVELTLPSVQGDFHPTSVSDVFESALLCTRERKGTRVLWMEYLSFLRSHAEEGTHMFKAFADCVHRCLVAVDTSCSHPCTLHGQPSSYEDYSFHNQVIDMVLSCLPCVYGYTLATMQSFTRILPRNPTLVARLVDCALNQTPEQVELAQSVLASFLAENPRCLLLWKMAIAVELKLGRVREARWMYHQAVKALPFHAVLWKEFLLFELRELVTSSHSTSLLSELATTTRHIGINLTLLFDT